MKQKEFQFFNMYKNLDLLIGKRFQVKNGMSYYIEQLEKMNQSTRLSLEDYHFLKNLKHLRHLRNQIAHDEDVRVTHDDIKLLKEVTHIFDKHKDILSQSKGRTINYLNILIVIVVCILVLFAFMNRWR